MFSSAGRGAAAASVAGDEGDGDPREEQQHRRRGADKLDIAEPGVLGGEAGGGDGERPERAEPTDARRQRRGRRGSTMNMMTSSVTTATIWLRTRAPIATRTRPASPPAERCARTARAAPRARQWQTPDRQDGNTRDGDGDGDEQRQHHPGCCEGDGLGGEEPPSVGRREQRAGDRAVAPLAADPDDGEHEDEEAARVGREHVDEDRVLGRLGQQRDERGDQHRRADGDDGDERRTCAWSAA